MKNKEDLKLNERLACRTLGNLKYRDDHFYKCRWNDTCMWIAKMLLLGRDPIEFTGWLFDADEEQENEIKKEFSRLER